MIVVVNAANTSGVLSNEHDQEGDNLGRMGVVQEEIGLTKRG
jgi:hypothetical protein